MPDEDARSVLGGETSKIIGACLTAWATGPFIADWEFATVTGLERAQVIEVAEAWPAIRSSNVSHAVTAALGNLLGYPHGFSLATHVGYDDSAVRNALDRWQSSPLCR